MAENGVRLEQASSARGGLDALGAYLELHIEQGPELAAAGASLAAVNGCVGIERLRLVFRGQASHAGTTPMGERRDAALAAAETALRVEATALELGGRATTGELVLEPNVATAVAGRATLTVDLRHGDAEALAAMLSAVLELAQAVAAARRCSLERQPVWRIEPVGFDPKLVAIASELADGRAMVSGALHDAAEVARAGVPTAMLFCPSIAGISHSREEDTAEEDLLLAIERFGQLVCGALVPDA
jgi:N-carbamoyl-L-amino-acid hydrolase